MNNRPVLKGTVPAGGRHETAIGRDGRQQATFRAPAGGRWALRPFEAVDGSYREWLATQCGAGRAAET